MKSILSPPIPPSLTFPPLQHPKPFFGFPPCGVWLSREAPSTRKCATPEVGDQVFEACPEELERSVWVWLLLLFEDSRRSPSSCRWTQLAASFLQAMNFVSYVVYGAKLALASGGMRSTPFEGRRLGGCAVAARSGALESGCCVHAKESSASNGFSPMGAQSAFVVRIVC